MKRLRWGIGLIINIIILGVIILCPIPSLLEWQSFTEGFPVAEGLFVIIVSFLLIVPIIILVRKDKWLGR